MKTGRCRNPDSIDASIAGIASINATSREPCTNTNTRMEQNYSDSSLTRNYEKVKPPGRKQHRDIVLL